MPRPRMPRMPRRLSRRELDRLVPILVVILLALLFNWLIGPGQPAGRAPAPTRFSPLS